MLENHENTKENDSFRHAYARPVLMATSKMQEKPESLEGRIKEIAYASSKNEKMAEKKTVN